MPDIQGMIKRKAGSLRIGLISDTHVPRDVKKVPPHVKEAFRGVDLILHAGDIYIPEVLDELQEVAPVLAASGNGDWDFPEDERFQRNHILNIGGLNLGITHGINYPGSKHYPVDKTVKKHFGNRLDIVVFGDTHVAVVDSFNGLLLVNPGSPTLPNGLYDLGTVGILDISGRKAEARIVQLSEIPLPFDPGIYC